MEAKVNLDKELREEHLAKVADGARAVERDLRLHLQRRRQKEQAKDVGS